MSTWAYGGYFEYCSNLTDLTINSNLFSSMVPSYTFEDCRKLPFESLNFSTCSTIGASAFRSCWLLSSFYAPNCSIIFEGAFANCSTLSSIVLNYSLISCVSSGTYSRTQISIASFPSCSFIGSSAFQYCSSL